MTPPDGDASAEIDKRPRRRRREKRHISIVGILGELLITAGALVLLFIGWQQWFNDVVVGDQQQSLSVKQSETWNKAPGPTKAPDPTTPPVLAGTVPSAQQFAQLIIPRFGGDWYRQVAQGIGTTAVLNKGEVGHYPDSQMPGAIGNFAVASHRTTYGANFNQLNKLHVGDHIFVETSDGWYQYEFRNLEYVKPTGVSVLDPVPEQPGLQPTDRIMTMTSCNPLYSAAERIIAYASFDTFYPRADGAPAEIAATVAGRS